MLRRLTGQPIATFANKKGRRTVCLNLNGQRRTAQVAPLVARAFHGPPPPGTECLHSDGNCSNDVATNLRWGTRGENILDSVAHGTHPQASKELCPRGHPLRPPNLVRAPYERLGHRECLSCDRASSKVGYWRVRGVELDLQEVSDEYLQEIEASQV